MLNNRNQDSLWSDSLLCGLKEISLQVLHIANGSLVELAASLMSRCRDRRSLSTRKARSRSEGILISIVHITEPGEEPTAHRLRPGELESYFQGWEILTVVKADRTIRLISAPWLKSWRGDRPVLDHTRKSSQFSAIANRKRRLLRFC